METEVICISSTDDESDSQKENRKTTSKSNQIEDDSILPSSKVETLSSDDEVQRNNLKRNISQISEEEKSTACNNVAKKPKLSISSQDASEIKIKDKDTSDYILQSDKDHDAIVEKPKLIVKERKRISYVTHDIFPMFISLCLQKQNDNDMNIIVNKLKRRYEQLNPAYANSESFALFLNEKRKAIMNNNKKLYVYIEEVMNEMKRGIRKKSKYTSHEHENYDAIASTSYTTSNLSVNDIAELDENNSRDVGSKTRKKINMIEKAMLKCQEMIKKLEEAEVDFDDEADSTYIKTERYKQRMIELHNKYCKLTGENIDAERVYVRPKHFSATEIVALDQAITNFVNSKIIRKNCTKNLRTSNDLIFPDYKDILECINRCNDKRNLGLDKRKREQLAEDAFKKVGKHLQVARQNDYWDTFSLYLEDNEEDPALKDEDLARKLAHNTEEGCKRLAAVFEKYAKKQEETMKLLGTEMTSEEENSIDDEEKDNLSVDSLSNGDNDSEEDIEALEETKLSVEKSKCNMIKESANQNSNKMTMNKIETDTSEQRPNKNKELELSEKESNVVVSDREETASKKEIHETTTKNTVATGGNVTDTKVREDSLTASTTNCTSTVNRTEESETKVATEAKVITDPATEMIMGKDDKAKVITENVGELITGDIVEMIEIMETIITKETEEEVAGETTEVSIEDAPSEKQLEEEKKPLLRVRSFAKPPTTWEDGRHKTEKAALEKNTSKVTNQTEDVIDLTNESSISKPMPVVTKCAIQLGKKIIPLVKAKRQTLVMSGSNIISVQNITNNLIVDTRTGQIIAPVSDAHRPTLIRVPSAQATTARSSQPQSTNTAITKSETAPRRNETILRIIQPNKAILLSKATEQVVSKTMSVQSPTKHM